MSLPAPSHAPDVPRPAPDPAAPGHAPADPPGGRVELEIGLTALVALVAALVYTRFYGGWGVLPTVAGAAVLPALVVGGARRRAWSTGRGLAVALLAAAPYAVWVVYWPATDGGLPGPAAWRALARGAAHGWAQMLSVGLPADARGDLLITPVLLTWLASALAAWLVVATASPLAPLGPLVGSFVVALGLVAAGGGPSAAVTAVLLGAALILVLLRAGRLAAAGVERARAGAPDGPGDGAADRGSDRAPTVVGGATRRSGAPGRRGRAGGWGALALGVPVVLVLAIVSTVAAAVSPGARGDRFDPRDLRSVPVEVDHTLNPLVGLKAQLTTKSPDELFTLRVDGLPQGVDRIRVAALDSYDGAQWTSSAEYRLAGRALPSDPLQVGHPQPSATIHEQITITGLRGPFLPVVGRPVHTGATGLGFDAASGTLVSAGRRLRGMHYEVDGRVGRLNQITRLADLDGARTPTAPALDAYRTPPPEVPDKLANLAKVWASESPDYSHELLAIRNELRRLRYDQSPDAPPGHSFGALTRMLTDDPADRKGYAEQFAAAFALLARERGFAARVVVGYLLPKPDAAGTYRITEAQAHAWPEVDLVGLGWVVIEPTDVSKIGTDRDRNDDRTDEPPEAPGDKGQQLDAQEPRVIVPDAATSTGGGAGLRQGAAIGGLVLLAVAAAVPIVSAAAKVGRRRRRRRAAAPSARVVGAWRETVDRLTEHGLAVADAQTTIEVAREATARFDGAVRAVAPLATMAAAAVYAPGEPSDATVRHAWELERTARRELGAVGGPARWLWSLADPRPLIRHWRRRARR